MEVTFIQRVLQVVTLWSMYLGIYNKKQKFKMLLQSSLISICSIVPFLGLFSMERYGENLAYFQGQNCL